ncbi:Translation initiation factor 3 subunit J component [Cystobasidiomycetes sp. EMM_F5]
MSDWDASEDETPAAKPVVKAPIKAAAARGKFADEESDDEPQVKESWEDSDEEEVAKPVATGPPPPIRQKGITKAKIAAKEAEEIARIQQQSERDNEDPAARKEREIRMQMEADLENAKSLFGGASLSNGDAATEGNSISSLISLANPKTKADFEQLSDALSKQIVDLYENKPLYAHFVEHFSRQLCLPLKDLDVKKVASTLTALGNEKQKQAKEASGAGKKGKGKGKPQLGAVAAGSAKAGVTGRGFAADLDAHDTALDNDYDDFM